MFSKKEKHEIFKKEIMKKYFKDDIFKNIDLQKESENKQYKIIKGIGEFIYGYDLNGLDYYFVFKDFKNEGFIWNRTSFKENGSFKTIDTFIPTKAYHNNVLKEKASEFNIDRLRNVFSYRFNINVQLQLIQLDFEKMLSLLNFSIFGSKYNKIQKIKVLGILLISFYFDFKEEIFLEINEDINNKLTARKSEEVDQFNQESDINYIFALYLISNINSIINKKISIFYLLKEFKKLQ